MTIFNDFYALIKRIEKKCFLGVPLNEKHLGVEVGKLVEAENKWKRRTR